MDIIYCLPEKILSIPVGRVKALKPLGHSGQRRLQEVVGSNEMEIG
jgi:hypothetical protein